MKFNPSMIRQTRKVIITNPKSIIDDELKSFVLQKKHFKIIDWKLGNNENGFLYNINQLAYLE
jgi:hypothetical protein